MTFQTQVLSSIKEFYFQKCMGHQSYAETVNDSLIQFQSTSYEEIGYDCMLGWVNNVTIGFSLEINGLVNVFIYNIPFNTTEKFYEELSEYVNGLVDCFYVEPIEYFELQKEYSAILTDFADSLGENEFGFSEDLQLDNYAKIMEILALPEPTEAEEYLLMVQNPLAGLTEAKSLYGRPDPKKFATAKRRSKIMRHARKFKKLVFNYEPNNFEFDDYAF
jgi:hypothetical protein